MPLSKPIRLSRDRPRITARRRESMPTRNYKMDHTNQPTPQRAILDPVNPDGSTLGGPVDIWADGSCRPNPGVGGYAAILRNGEGNEKVVRGAEIATTNNRMELIAAISGLEALKRPCRVAMHSDSEYVCRGMTDRLPQWKANRWRTNAGGPVANADLWRRLEAAAAAHQVEWHLVKGHAGDPMNERVHRIANAAREHLQNA